MLLRIWYDTTQRGFFKSHDMVLYLFSGTVSINASLGNFYLEASYPGDVLSSSDAKYCSPMKQELLLILPLGLSFHPVATPMLLRVVQIKLESPHIL